MHIKVRWTLIDGVRSPLWDRSLCLYAYLHPIRESLLYLGKADRCSVGSRLYGAHKDEVVRAINKRYRINQLIAMHGEIILPTGHRRTSQLLTDIESLLIIHVRPPMNIRSTKSATLQDGLSVTCTGAWPLKRARFRAG
jgi:hypothetical protein